MVQPGSMVPTKIRESTRIYPYFKDCVGAIDGTHILAMVSGPKVASYRDPHGKISQNVLAACNFDLEFIYILNDESEDEENYDELGNQTQEQQRQIANAWRASIAINMWTDAMSDSIQR
ncbi:unnamed protein product [Malus baccata var. baccata]